MLNAQIPKMPGILIGGENVNHEKSRLRKGLAVLLATPGRMMYHLENSKQMSIGQCHTACAAYYSTAVRDAVARCMVRLPCTLSPGTWDPGPCLTPTPQTP